MAKGTAARIGRTLYFDFEKTGVPDSNGDLTVVENENAVTESLLNILRTEPNSRVYKQRDFGAGLDQYLFEPIDITTANRILETIELSISRFEGRAKNVIVEITPLHDEQTFKIDITSTVDESNKPIQLVTTLEKLR